MQRLSSNPDKHRDLNLLCGPSCYNREGTGILGPGDSLTGWQSALPQPRAWGLGNDPDLPLRSLSLPQELGKGDGGGDSPLWGGVGGSTSTGEVSWIPSGPAQA